jgi:hypothetical protein
MWARQRCIVVRRAQGMALFLALLLGAPAALRGQSVSGHVIDGMTRAPVADVAVTVLDATGQARGTVLTDSAGVFRMPIPAAGRYQLRAQHAGHATWTSIAMQFRRGERVAVQIELGPNVVGLAPIHVTGRAREAPSHLDQFHDRVRRQRALGLGRFITREELDRTSTTDVQELLIREPSLRYFYPAANDQVGVPIVLERRGGRCVPMLFMDGMPIGRTDRTELRTMVSTEEIEGIEIYRSAAEMPADLADECGVIAVWTRRAVVGQGLGNPFTVRRVAIAAGFLTLMTLMVR